MPHPIQNNPADKLSGIKVSFENYKIYYIQEIISLSIFLVFTSSQCIETFLQSIDYVELWLSKNWIVQLVSKLYVIILISFDREFYPLQVSEVKKVLKRNIFKLSSTVLFFPRTGWVNGVNPSNHPKFIEAKIFMMFNNSINFMLLWIKKSLWNIGFLLHIFI